MVINRTRVDLEDELGRELPDQTWDYLVEKRFVADYEVAEQTIGWLADEARAILHAAGQGTARRRPAEKMLRSTQVQDDLGYRFSVLSALLASDARKDEYV